MCLISDISDRNRLARELEAFSQNLEWVVERRTEELQIALDAADAANRAKAAFLSKMSHELRTPLNAIIGFSQLLELGTSSAISEEQRDSVEEVLKAGRHLLGLVDEILEFASLDVDLESLLIQTVEVVPILRECLETMGNAARRQNISMRMDSKIEFLVLADSGRLRRIILGLLTNAIQYNNKGGTVAVFCVRLPSEQVRIAVRDSGPGIAEDSLQRIFQPFEGTGKTPEGRGGIGMSLALCKKLIEAMGGKIGVESRLGEGSEFWIELPEAGRFSGAKGI